MCTQREVSGRETEVNLQARRVVEPERDLLEGKVDALEQQLGHQPHRQQLQHSVHLPPPSWPLPTPRGFVFCMHGCGRPRLVGVSGL